MVREKRLNEHIYGTDKEIPQQTNKHINGMK